MLNSALLASCGKSAVEEPDRPACKVRTRVGKFFLRDFENPMIIMAMNSQLD
jgi:hypothetical protein